jgi:hypothetical protein
MKNIMTKTTDELRELRDDELDAVSGGTTIVPNRQTINARMDLGGVGDAGTAVETWNTLLGNYGFK